MVVMTFHHQHSFVLFGASILCKIGRPYSIPKFRWDFDRSTYPESVVSQFSLVCANDYWRSLAQVLQCMEFSYKCKLYLFVKNLEFDSPPESVWLTSRVCTCSGSWWELLGLAFSPISEPPTLLCQISSHCQHHHCQHRPLDQVWSEDDLPGRLPGHHHLRLLHLPLLIHAGVRCWLCWWRCWLWLWW